MLQACHAAALDSTPEVYAGEPAECDVGKLAGVRGDDLFADQPGYPALDGERRRLPIGPYGYRWLRLAQDGIGAT